MANINKKLFGTVSVELKADPPNQKRIYALADSSNPVAMDKSAITDGLFFQMKVPLSLWYMMPKTSNNLTELSWNQSTNPSTTALTIEYDTSPLLGRFQGVMELSKATMIPPPTDQQILE